MEKYINNLKYLDKINFIIRKIYNLTLSLKIVNTI